MDGFTWNKNTTTRPITTYHRLIRNRIKALLFTTHRKQKTIHAEIFYYNNRVLGEWWSPGRLQIEQQTNALLFKIINPIAQIKSKIEYSKQSNIIFTHYGKFRIKQSSSSIIQTWANNEICTWEQNETSSTGQKSLYTSSGFETDQYNWNKTNNSNNQS